MSSDLELSSVLGKLTVLTDDQVNRLDLGLASSDAPLIDILHIQLILGIALHQLPDGLHGIEVLENTIEVAGVSDILEANGVCNGAPLEIVRVVEKRTRFTVPRNGSQGISHDPGFRLLCLNIMSKVPFQTKVMIYGALPGPLRSE